MKSTIKPYKDLTGQWRWKALAGNGKTIADSGEGYKTKAGLRKGIKALHKLFQNPDVLADFDHDMEALK